MICEPNFSLPRKISLVALGKAEKTEHSHKQESDPKIEPDILKHNISYEQSQYKILPKFYDQFVHLNSVLSLRENEYLRCRWNQFLNNVPNDYVRIRRFSDYNKDKEKHFVRRKILNGNFYGVDNKLAPIPQLSDPRNYSKTKNK